MSPNLPGVRSAFDALSIASNLAFRRLLGDGKLRHSGSDGAPDLIDELSARLVCSAFGSSGCLATLVVFPDRLARRSPLVFAAALVMDAVAHIGDSASRRVLYLSNQAGIRTQLANVRVSSLTLDGVFAHHHGRGQAQGLRPLALPGPGGASLPTVVSVCAPADPSSLLREHKPKWVAVDCSEAPEIEWLQVLLGESRRMGIPVVGWTTRPFSDVVPQWRRAGGGVLRWPTVREGTNARITTLEELATQAVTADVAPRVLAGEHVYKVSRALASATEALVAASEFQKGRLSTDATGLGWRYLRAVESTSVPIEVFEREAHNYWGVRRLADLREAFERFVDAVRSVSPKLHSELQAAVDALSVAVDTLAACEPPLWLGLANLCIESGRRRIVFSSKSRREMFSLCLLARFNISEDDLGQVGISLDYLGRGNDHEVVSLLGSSSKHRKDDIVPVFVGLPSPYAERRLDGLFHCGTAEIVVWPHQEHVLARRLRALSAQLTFSSRGLTTLLPDSEESTQPSGERLDWPAPLRVVASRDLGAGGPHDQLRQRAADVELWKRPDAAEAIATLFGTHTGAEDDEDRGAAPLLDDDPQASEPDAAETAWVPNGYELSFEDGRRLLLARDETVNVIVRKHSGAELEERYVRAIRPGDEILFIQGQKRQSLYDLLVSRVHRDPVIGQYLALISRWQNDLVRSFSELERRTGLTPENLLVDLQKRGSSLVSAQTIRTWLRRRVLAPNDAEDLQRVAEALSMTFVTSYFRQIHKAGRRLKGLHISLSARLNRWLASGNAGSAAVGDADSVVDSELGLSIEDFRHSLIRLRVAGLTEQQGPFYKPHMGRLEGGNT